LLEIASDRARTLIQVINPDAGTSRRNSAFPGPMTAENPHAEPSEVTAEEGEVVVDGPDGVAVSLTPEAAIETSDRLLDAALMAQGQRVDKRRKPHPPEG
jgi:hypothetical protein